MASRDKVKYWCEAKYLLRPGTIQIIGLLIPTNLIPYYLLTLTYLGSMISIKRAIIYAVRYTVSFYKAIRNVVQTWATTTHLRRFQTKLSMCAVFYSLLHCASLFNTTKIDNKRYQWATQTLLFVVSSFKNITRVVVGDSVSWLHWTHWSPSPGKAVGCLTRAHCRSCKCVSLTQEAITICSTTLNNNYWSHLYFSAVDRVSWAPADVRGAPNAWP